MNDLDGVLQHFDDVLGLSRLKAVHFNDSKNDRGSHKDRHEKLGHGSIGMEAMKRIDPAGSLVRTVKTGMPPLFNVFAMQR